MTIENYNQYKVTKEQLAKFQSALEAIPPTPAADVHPVLHQAQIDGLTSFRDELKAEIQEYEQRVRMKICDASNLLAGRHREEHLRGVALMKEARQLLPEFMKEIDERFERTCIVTNPEEMEEYS